MSFSNPATSRLVAAAKVAAVAPNTSDTYASAWRSWQRWVALNGTCEFPASTQDIQAWLVDLAAEGKKPTTIRTYLFAVAHHHRGNSGDNPARHFEVRQLMSGIARQADAAGYEPKQANPLRWHHIQQIIQHADKLLAQPGMRPQDRQRILADIAMIAVSHNAALRCSELLALTWGDVSRSDHAETGSVLIRRSKTDQTAQGAVCPISTYALQALDRIRPPNAHSHDRIFPISASTVRRRLRAAAKAAGIDPTGITTHSPRIGLAQDLAATGADMPALMIAGRWKQPATVARYIRNLAADHTPAAQYLRTQCSIPAKPNALRLLAENFPRLQALATGLPPIANGATRQAQSIANYSMRSLVKELVAQLATFSPGMGERVGQGRLRLTGWPRLITLRRLARSAKTVTSAAGSPSTTSTPAAMPGARTLTSPAMRRAMAPLAVAQEMA